MEELASPAEFGNFGSLLLDGDDVVSRVHSRYSEARQHRSQFDKDWPRYWLIYIGRHWDGRQAEWMSTPVINLTASFIHTVGPILTDSKPQISVIPRLPETDKVASVLSAATEWNWERLDLEALLPKTVKSTMIFGNAFWKFFWNPSLADGKGDIDVIAVDPSHIFISPYAKDIYSSEYVIHAENFPRDYVQKVYGVLLPDDNGPSEPDLTIQRPMTSSQIAGQGGTGIFNMAETTGGNVQWYSGADSLTGDRESGRDLVTVYEEWCKKPDGKLCQTVVVNDKPLFEREYPYTGGRFPFVHFVDEPNTWSPWAAGEVQQVEKLQLEINRRRGHLMDILRYTANPMLVVDPASGLEYENLIARPGLVIPAEGGLAAVQWLQPPNIPSALFEINSMDKIDFDNVLGNVEILQGRRPAGVEAGVAMEILQEAANVRMRQKVRYLENSIKKAGELMVAMMQELYTEERVFRIVGMESMMMEHPITPDGWLRINQQTMGADGMPMVMNQIPTGAEAQFDVRVGTGSTLPVSRANEFQKAASLFQLGILDDEGVMSKSGLPHWQEELQRSRLYWAQKQAMMAGAEIPSEPGEVPQEEMDMAMAGGEVPPGPPELE